MKRNLFEGDSVALDFIIGKTFSKVQRVGETICFVTPTGVMFCLGQKYGSDHNIEEVHGDLEDLVGSPILNAEEVHSPSEDDSIDREPWFFYKFHTTKGYVTVRYYGHDGYYACAADFWVDADPNGELSSPGFIVKGGGHWEHKDYSRDTVIYRRDSAREVVGIEEAKRQAISYLQDNAERLRNEYSNAQRQIAAAKKRMEQIEGLIPLVEAQIPVVEALEVDLSEVDDDCVVYNFKGVNINWN